MNSLYTLLLIFSGSHGPVTVQVTDLPQYECTSQHTAIRGKLGTMLIYSDCIKQGNS
jgi:hypothetical protein